MAGLVIKYLVLQMNKWHIYLQCKAMILKIVLHSGLYEVVCRPRIKQIKTHFKKHNLTFSIAGHKM